MQLSCLSIGIIFLNGNFAEYRLVSKLHACQIVCILCRHTGRIHTDGNNIICQCISRRCLDLFQIIGAATPQIIRFQFSVRNLVNARCLFRTVLIINGCFVGASLFRIQLKLCPLQTGIAMSLFIGAVLVYLHNINGSFFVSVCYPGNICFGILRWSFFQCVSPYTIRIFLPTVILIQSDFYPSCKFRIKNNVFIVPCIILCQRIGIGDFPFLIFDLLLCQLLCPCFCHAGGKINILIQFQLVR